MFTFMGETVSPSFSLDIWRADIGLFLYWLWPICDEFIERGTMKSPCLVKLSLFEDDRPVACLEV